MDVHIENYQITDHEEVRNLFYDGKVSQAKSGIKRSLKNPSKSIIALLLILYNVSLMTKLIIVVLSILTQCILISAQYIIYAR